MLQGVNDAPEQARELLTLVADVECKVNLIAFNAHKGTRFTASPSEVMKAFQAILTEGGLVCTVRDSRGDDQMAACGQLGNPQAAREHRLRASGAKESLRQDRATASVTIDAL